MGGYILDNKSIIVEFCKHMGLNTIGVSRCEPFLDLKPYLIKRKELELENE